jgi:hypothetical protein
VVGQVKPHLSDEAVVHAVDTDGLGQTLLGADEDGVVVVLKVSSLFHWFLTKPAPPP